MMKRALLTAAAALGVLALSEARAQYDDYDKPIKRKPSLSRSSSSGAQAAATPTPPATSTPSASSEITPTATPKGASPFERNVNFFD